MHTSVITDSFTKVDPQRPQKWLRWKPVSALELMTLNLNVFEKNRARRYSVWCFVNPVRTGGGGILHFSGGLLPINFEVVRLFGDFSQNLMPNKVKVRNFEI